MTDQWQKGMTPIVGQRFGRLVFVGETGSNIRGHKLWDLLCDCGVKTRAIRNNVVSGCTKSCGCYGAERRKTARLKHGKKHERIYHIWCSMLARCNNKNNKVYGHYGARGIGVFPAWEKSFAEFYAYIGDPPSKAHSLDRIDNNLGYQPGNIRWATTHEQMQNCRTAKLTADKVRQIRESYAAGTSPKSLAEHYGVIPSHITKIVNRKAWPNV